MHKFINRMFIDGKDGKLKSYPFLRFTICPEEEVQSFHVTKTYILLVFDSCMRVYDYFGNFCEEINFESLRISLVICNRFLDVFIVFFSNVYNINGSYFHKLDGLNDGFEEVYLTRENQKDNNTLQVLSGDLSKCGSHVAVIEYNGDLLAGMLDIPSKNIIESRHFLNNKTREYEKVKDASRVLFAELTEAIVCVHCKSSLFYLINCRTNQIIHKHDANFVPGLPLIAWSSSNALCLIDEASELRVWHVTETLESLPVVPNHGTPFFGVHCALVCHDEEKKYAKVVHLNSLSKTTFPKDALPFALFKHAFLRNEHGVPTHILFGEHVICCVAVNKFSVNNMQDYSAEFRSLVFCLMVIMEKIRKGNVVLGKCLVPCLPCEMIFNIISFLYDN